MNCKCFSGRVAAEKWLGLCLRGALEGAFGDGAAGNVQLELAVGLLKGRVKQQQVVLP